GDVMRHRPRRSTDRVIDGPMASSILLTGVVMAAATLAAIDLGLPGGLLRGDLLPGMGTVDVARTMGFTVIVLASLCIAYSSRSPNESAFRRLASNPRLVGAVV